MFIKRLALYLIERFSLYFITPALILHFLFIVNYFTSYFNDFRIVPFLTFYLFFVSMRLLDELKDKSHDDIYYNQRPVQRGLISLNEIGSLLSGIIFFLLIINFSLNTGGGNLYFILLLGYLYLMRYEFFIRNYIRKRLMLYLALHQAVIVLLILYIFASYGANIHSLNSWVFVGLNLLIILSAEIARKIRSTKEDQTGNDTYSSFLGRKTAVVLWLSNILLIIIFTQFLFNSSIYLWILFILTTIVGIIYLKLDTSKSARMILIANITVITLLIIYILRI